MILPTATPWPAGVEPFATREMLSLSHDGPIPPHLMAAAEASERALRARGLAVPSVFAPVPAPAARVVRLKPAAIIAAMAETMRDRAAAADACTEGDLVLAGYPRDLVAKFMEPAALMAAARASQQRRAA